MTERDDEPLRLADDELWIERVLGISLGVLIGLAVALVAALLLFVLLF